MLKDVDVLQRLIKDRHGGFLFLRLVLPLPHHQTLDLRWRSAHEEVEDDLADLLSFRFQQPGRAVGTQARVQGHQKGPPAIIRQAQESCVSLQTRFLDIFKDHCGVLVPHDETMKRLWLQRCIMAKHSNQISGGAQSVRDVTQGLQRPKHGEDIGLRLDWEVDQTIVNCSGEWADRWIPRSKSRYLTAEGQCDGAVLGIGPPGAVLILFLSICGVPVLAISWSIPQGTHHLCVPPAGR
mmetsp:Transcript_76727/g.169530  ORF Transcript_76727/g.169530 Transcript_76727/m.169530 type:complete len:238 (-) Transcript_76727:169-882(-)